MKLLEEIYVSVYDSVYSKQPRTMSFLEVVSQCIQPVHAPLVSAIRGYHEEGDREAVQQMKLKLNCFTPAGTFDGAHSIKNFLLPSNIIGLDYDHVPNRLEIIKRCKADPHTVSALESPTDGVKVFAYVEGIEGRHREAQQMVSSYYDKLLQLTSDPACKDESRLCYFTYSSNGYLASLYQPFELPPLAAQQPSDSEEKAENTAKETETGSPKDTYEFLQNVPSEETNQFVSSFIFLSPLVSGQRHTNLFKLACEACKRHYPMESILREVKQYMKLTDFPDKELRSVFKSGYEYIIKQANQTNSSTPTHSPTSKLPLLPKLPPMPPEETEETEEAYWQGEELRKNTPAFPDEVFENLPELLAACLIEDGSIRERDISFLSDITALSAVLPQTFGIYNHKKYSTHLYSIILSPAGSGKSIAQTGRYLLEELHDSILTVSQQQQKNYKHEHSTWQADCNKKNRGGSPRPEEPVAPPFKMLIIPATTSYTRMQMHMQDNGTQGSIIFDTEAQTLSSANHLDCGNFDDMLRKAFEHENIDSSYKANGLIPIFVRRPRLALILTGTPAQLKGLLDSSENGLASRILYYTFREAPHWKDMGDECESIEDHFKPLAHRVTQLYEFCLMNPVLFHLTRPQWDKLNKTFSRLLEEVALEANDDLQAVVKRYAFMVMRISMIQTRIRQFETQDVSSEIYCSDEDFSHSLQIVLCCYEHSRLLLSSMTTPSIQPLKNPDIIRRFYEDLPSVFTTEEAIRVGAIYGFSLRKIARLLKALNNLRINKVSHGIYEKLK